MKIKLNIISMILGLILIGISVYIGYSNNFVGDSGFGFLIIGAPLTVVGFIFTPKIWEWTLYFVDMAVMFFGSL